MIEIESYFLQLSISTIDSNCTVLVKKQNLESSTSFLFLCLKRLETRKVYKYKFHMHVP